MPTDEQTIHGPCEECNARQKFWEYVAEVKKKPFQERMDLGFSVFGALFGMTAVVIVLAVLVSWFRKELWSLISDPKSAIRQIAGKDDGQNG